MADVTIFKPASLSISVIDGVPPIDQTALVAALTAQVDSLNTALTDMTAARDTVVTERDGLIGKIVAARAALA